jgi:hypothetical protein
MEEREYTDQVVLGVIHNLELWSVLASVELGADRNASLAVGELVDYLSHGLVLGANGLYHQGGPDQYQPDIDIADENVSLQPAVHQSTQ